MSILERELKLDLAAEFDSEGLVGSMGDWTFERGDSLRFDGTYYDTPGLRLLRAGMSLRYRDGWLVKLPQPTDRPELMQRMEVPLEGRPGQLPVEALDLVRSAARDCALVPVAMLSTRRQVFVVRDHSGTSLAEVTYDQVTADVDGVLVPFRELEVELGADADLEALEPIVTRLRELGGGSFLNLPKVARALEIEGRPDPEVVVAEVGQSSTAGELVQAAIARSVRRFLEHAPAVVLDEDPEGVHQARVATRRLRSDLRVFRPFLDRSWADGLRSDLRWLTDVLGGVRDLDVMGERFTEMLPSVPTPELESAQEILAALQEERAAAVTAVIEAFREPFYVDLLDRLVDAAAGPPMRAEANAIAPGRLIELTRKPWKKLRRAVDALPEKPSPDELHRLRIRTKRARYAAEAVADLGGESAELFSVALEELQDVLGEHQDAVVAARWLRGLEQHLALAAGELIGFEIERANRSAEDWRDIWRSLNRPELTAWLG